MLSVVTPVDEISRILSVVFDGCCLRILEATTVNTTLQCCSRLNGTAFKIKIYDLS